MAFQTKKDQKSNRYDNMGKSLQMEQWLNGHSITHSHTPNLEMLSHLIT